MKFNIKIENDKTELQLIERLTFSDEIEFDKILSEIFENSPKEIVINLSKLLYMDSVGLGLLLTIRENAIKENAEVSLCRPVEDVKELLENACFNTLFKIED
ncbi:MAG: STAS domain-containing protein [Alphaproteobacteria bacterium]|nr:STAS domain-containing protein [Alphaproteobacteria bacterium]